MPLREPWRCRKRYRRNNIKGNHLRIEHLTTDEILRIYSPETELERVLFDRIQGALDDVDDAQQLAGEDCGECYAKDDEISDNESKIEDLEEKIIKLEAALDEHEIDHSEIKL